MGTLLDDAAALATDGTAAGNKLYDNDEVATELAGSRLPNDEDIVIYVLTPFRYDKKRVLYYRTTH